MKVKFLVEIWNKYLKFRATCHQLNFWELETEVDIMARFRAQYLGHVIQGNLAVEMLWVARLRFGGRYQGKIEKRKKLSVSTSIKIY